LTLEPMRDTAAAITGDVCRARFQAQPIADGLAM
jgi:hypothetical protein